MPKKFWMILILMLLIPGLLFTFSCAKKTVKSDTAITQPADDDADLKAKEAAEKARLEELAKQKALEEESLREEAAGREAARNMFLNEDIYFEFDSSALLPEAQEILKKKAEWLQENGGVAATIEGHCDERGTNEYNLALGDRRAQNALSFLVNLGVSGSRLTSISFGEERPVDLGSSEEAWSKNRRTHFAID
jgi:peptidoglycan-associated lipoprotein